MNKRKTHNGLKKRVTVSASGKVRFKKSFAGHLMSGKPGQRRLRLRRKGQLTGALVRRALRSLGEA